MSRRTFVDGGRRVFVVVTSFIAVLATAAAAAGVTALVHRDDPSGEPQVVAAGSAPIQPAVLAVRNAHRAYTGGIRREHAAEQSAAAQGDVVATTFEEISERSAEKPEPPPPPPPPPAPAAPAAPAVASGSLWDRLAACESGGNWGARHGLYEGGLQFHPGTWDRNRDPGMPEAAYLASREQQIVVGKRVQARQGWSAWPACARRLGLY